MADIPIEEILTSDLAGLPDYDQLGGRLFITDGRHCNKVVMDSSYTSRVMGAKEQVQALDVSYEEDSEGPFSRGDAVTYAVRRVITAHGLDVAGGIALDYYQIPFDDSAEPGADPAKVKCSLAIYPYEYSLDGVSSIRYEVYRSKPENTELLYLAATLTHEQVLALESHRYTDEAAWEDVPVNFTVNLSSDGMELAIPPCSFVRAWRGALVMGGYRRRKVSFSLVSGAVYSAANGSVAVDDIGCFVSCADGMHSSQIVSVAVGETETTVTMNEALSGDASEATLWRDDDVVYVSRPLSGNIEAYSAESGRLITTSGSGNAITGIASNGTYAYVFRKNNVEILTGVPGSESLEPFPSSPPGCRAHATIADKHSPFVIYYAGACGVWVISGSEARSISSSIDNFIRNEIDHTQDEYCHAVYEPRKKMYWLFAFSRKWYLSGVRMPDMVLIYDVVAGAWTRGEMYATCSGLWKDAAGELVPVIGIPGGVARLDIGNTDGPTGVSGHVTSFGQNWFTLSEGHSGELDKVVAGMPVYFGGYDLGRRRVVKCSEDGIVTIYGAVPDDLTAGCFVTIGHIRWKMTTPEVGLSGYFDRSMKLEGVSLAHGRSRDALPVKVRIQGIGELSDEASDSQVWEGRMDFHERTVSRLDGRATGLRGASVMMSVSGEHSPALIKAVRIDMQKVQR